MKIIVGKHDIRLENEPINEKEMNINSCEFEFDEDIVGFNKEAYFTKDNTTYKMIILNDTCEIPNEVLVSEGKVELGVSYFKIENNETTRYNPSPTYFYVLDGSLKDKTKNGLVIKTPSELEQFENEIEDYIKTLNIDIDVSKEGNTTTVIATNANGEHHSVEIYDGEPGPAGQDGYSPSASVSKSGTTTTITITDKNGTTTANVNDGANGRDGQDGYTPVKGVDYFTQEDIASLNIPTDTNDLTNGAGYITKAVNDLTYYYTTSNTYTKTEVDTLIGNINQFKVEIVSVLPIQDIDTHTIYLVAKTGSTGDIYNEYIYINNNWELIGSTEVDLSNYYTKGETDTLLSSKANSSDLSTVATSGSYSDLSNTPTIPTALSDLSDDSTHRLVTDTEKTTWSGKQDTLSAGTNISISNNTISATDTTYESKTASSGGTDVSLCTTGEKYTWNNKQDTLVSGTSIKTINNESVLGSGNISISSGTPTDVQINGTSIVSSNIANIITNTAYDDTTNKIATMSDLPDISGKLDTSKVVTSTSTTSGDVYDVTYINTMLGNIETLLSEV